MESLDRQTPFGCCWHSRPKSKSKLELELSETVVAAIHIDNQNDSLATVAHTCATCVAAGIDVVVAVVLVPEEHIVAVLEIDNHR